MSRAATGDRVVLKPSNNIYTVLAGAALVVQIIAIVVLYMRWTTVFGTGMFNP